ncbi:MAG: helix-turn-helix transcriptional regulator [Tenuifilaceae bacterium]|jgi:DNA-binding Xre family transcriptional regulator|nr:helix-turn-helix transcriptional regulator [Tenuifilaceae bacterium]
MIRYNFERIFKARGVERPFSFLRTAGFSDNLATKLKQNRVKRLNLETLERLCIVLKCTPNDFFEWTPNPEENLNDNHPLNAIRRSDKVLSITQMLNDVPLGQLENIEKLVNDTVKKLQHPTRGVSNVGDVMTSGQQNPHGGGTNGG